MNKDGGGSLDLLNMRSMAKVYFYSYEYHLKFSSQFQIASEIGPQLNDLLMNKIQLSKEKQAIWGHTNERLLFDDDNFV
jgi:hypothetical protein